MKQRKKLRKPHVNIHTSKVPSPCFMLKSTAGITSVTFLFLTTAHLNQLPHSYFTCIIT